MKPPSKDEQRKPSKTLAGVTPVAVMLKPRKCKHGTCLYCPSLGVPQSYTPLSPATMRASMLKYNPYNQVEARIKAFEAMHHPTDKIELIVMGGTFLEYPLNYQYEFIKSCYDAMNKKISKNLQEAKKLNETAQHRCVALCIETRPDVCGEKEIKRLLEFGCTRVELGVQAIDDNIYKKIERGHTVKEVIIATRKLKEAGFKVGYHIMPGLPGSNFNKDIQMFKKIFSNENFKPDQLKIYPCQVIKGSKLEELYNKGKYKPYSKEKIQKILIDMLKIIPEYCRVMRIMREIAPSYITAGTTRIDLRKDIDEYLKKNKIKLNEIRFREIGFNIRDNPRENISKNLKIKKTEYFSSNGKEIFLEIINKDNLLFGLLRLRFQKDTFIDELKNAAIIREIHIYGKAEKIGEKGNIQHTGLGKKLMLEAEKIVNQNKNKYNIKKIAVISGVGVRKYYEKLGYHLDKYYMIKNLA